MKEFELQPIKRKFSIEGFNSIYYFEFGKDFTHAPEKHDFWEFVYVDSGEIIAITDGLGTPLSQGQVIFHKPMEIHAHISNNIDPNNMLVVSFTSHSEAMKFFDKKIFTLNKMQKTLLSFFSKEAQKAFGAIPSDYNDKSAPDFSGAPDNSLQLMECYLIEFLIQLSNDGEAVSNESEQHRSRELGQNSIIELAISYLGENISNSITLNDVCRNFYMCKSSMCKLFHDYTGKSPMEYYMALKMKEAKRLLRDEGLSVSRVSDMLGYSSIHNFSRAFKNIYRISPMEYKNKIIY